MKIALLLPGLERGGAEVRTAALAIGLREAGCDVAVATLRPGGDPDLRSGLERSGIAVHAARELGGWRALLAFCDRAEGGRRLAIHSAMTSAGLMGLALRRRFAAPLVHSFTNSLRPDRPGLPSWLARATWLADASLVRTAEAIHAVSPSVGRQLQRRFPRLRDKVIVIPDLAPEAHSAPEDRAAAALRTPAARNADLRVLMLGRVVAHKGHRLLLEALPEIVAERPKVHAVIAGDGPGRNALERRIARLGMGRYVTFAGETSSPRSFLEWADVVVNTSWYEGLSRAALEAARLGVAVVATTSPAARDLSRLFPGLVRLVPSRSSVALARALLGVAEAGLPSTPAHPNPESPRTAAADMLSLYSRVVDRACARWPASPTPEVLS